MDQLTQLNVELMQLIHGSHQQVNAPTVGTMFLQCMPTPLGILLAGATQQGLAYLSFVDDMSDLARHYTRIRRRFTGDLYQQDHVLLQITQAQLSEYFNHQRTSFEISLDPYGTDFQQQVWQSLLRIPCGTTISYEEQSLHLNQPKAIRAIASANGANPIAIIVPCHRVIGKNGSLTGYAGGLARKKWLIQHEQTQRQLVLVPDMV